MLFYGLCFIALCFAIRFHAEIVELVLCGLVLLATLALLPAVAAMFWAFAHFVMHAV